MFRMTKPQVFCLIFMMALLLVPALPAAAQAEDTTSAPTPPPAPRVVVKLASLPYQVQAAKKIFLSNGGAGTDRLFPAGAARPLTQFESCLERLGPDLLSPAPPQARLGFSRLFSLSTSRP